MASLTSANGSSSAADSKLSPAEKLKARHAANTSGDHHVLLEDVIDEDDLAHPPPSSSRSQPGPSTSSGRSNNVETDTAAGSGDSARAKKYTSVPLNVNSEEMFPSLGSGKTTTTKPLQTWSRKPVTQTNVNLTGPTNGISAAAKGKGPRLPPQPAAPINSGAQPNLGTISLPGRIVEKIAFAPSQITPRDQLKKPILEILRDINKKSKARVEVKEGTNGYLVFEGTGSQEAVRLALKEVANQIGSKVSSTDLYLRSYHLANKS
jgi:hypothetical protein